MDNFEQASKKESVTKSWLDDLRMVGPEKPVGYLPMDTLTQSCRVPAEQMRTELERRGLKVIMLTQEESSVGSGAFFTYDEKALNELLQRHQAVLTSSGWPTDPEQFVRNLKVSAESKTELFDVIADAFGDMTNPGRKVFPNAKRPK